MRAAVSGFAALLCAACSLNADYGGTEFRCTDGVCPPGYTCVAEACVQGVPDAADLDTIDVPDSSVPPPDAMLGAPDAAPPVACGRPDVFTDAFDDGVMDPMWAGGGIDPGAPLAESGGELVISPSGAGNDYSSYATNRWFDLAEGRFFIEIPTMVNTATHAQVFFRARLDDNNTLYLMQDNGMLYLRRRVGGTTTTLGMVPYVASDHRWWQLRSAGGMTYWEVSSDGSGWVPLAMEPDQPFIHNVRIEVLAGTYQVETSPGAVHFDNFNGGGTPTGVWCPTSTYQDDFQDGVEGVLWNRSYGTTCVRAENGGQATFTPSATTTAYCAYVSGTSFDLTGDGIVVELVSGPDPGSNGNAYLKADRDSDNNVEFLLGGGNLFARTEIAASLMIIDSVPYDPAVHRWLRIREAGGNIFWDTSDGTTWTNLTSAPAAFPITRVDAVIGAGSEGASTVSPGVVRFDNYNLPP